MKISGALLLAGGAAAFPALSPGAAPANVEKRQIPGVAGLSRTFNAERQRIDVSGIHKFVPPNFAKGDQRGPCPGLNALANHGYLPHNGVGNIAQFTASTNQVFGMGLDVSLAFATYGALVAGDGLSWSIGGPPNSGLSTLLPGLLGKPSGISFSHNTYEGDGSATRNDFYTSGDAYSVNMDNFRELYDNLPADSFAKISNFRNTRVQKQVATNPYYFNGPFTGVAIAGGATNFVFRLAANCSQEYPQGFLSKDTFASLWAVDNSAGDDALVYKPGWDRIPEDWYRRPHDDEYSIPFVALDLARYYVDHPDSARIGGNTGKTNSFVGVDVSNLTGGVFNAANLAEGNNAACLAYQFAALGAPDLLLPLFKDITKPLKQLQSAFGGLLAPLGCPQLEEMDQTFLEQFPGYTNPKAHQ